MVEDAVAAQPLGRAGDFAAVHQYVVAAAGGGGEPQLTQRLDHRLREARKGQLFFLSRIGDEGVVQIAQIVVHGAAAGAAAYHADMVRLHKVGVDLLCRVLVAPHHHGVVVLPQQQVVALCAMGQDVFLKRQIIVRVGGSCFEIIDHA